MPIDKRQLAIRVSAAASKKRRQILRPGYWSRKDPTQWGREKEPTTSAKMHFLPAWTLPYRGTATGGAREGAGRPLEYPYHLMERGDFVFIDGESGSGRAICRWLKKKFPAMVFRAYAFKIDQVIFPTNAVVRVH